MMKIFLFALSLFSGIAAAQVETQQLDRSANTDSTYTIYLENDGKTLGSIPTKVPHVSEAHVLACFRYGDASGPRCFYRHDTDGRVVLVTTETNAERISEKSAPAATEPHVTGWMLTGCSANDWDLYIVYSNGVIVHVNPETSPGESTLRGVIGDVKGAIKHYNCVAATP